jgi:hypothetical protein
MTKPKKEIIGSIQGRNGLVDIVELDIWTGSEGNVFIDGIGQRGNAINGGFLSLNAGVVEKAFTEWLEGRGYTVHAPAVPTRIKLSKHKSKEVIHAES